MLERILFLRRFISEITYLRKYTPKRILLRKYTSEETLLGKYGSDKILWKKTLLRGSFIVNSILKGSFQRKLFTEDPFKRPFWAKTLPEDFLPRENLPERKPFKVLAEETKNLLREHPPRENPWAKPLPRENSSERFPWRFPAGPLGWWKGDRTLRMGFLCESRTACALYLPERSRDCTQTLAMTDGKGS